jgi:hypothetical protein
VNNAKNKNIQYVSHVGDLTDGSTDTEWIVVKRNFDKLLKNDIAHGFVPGNHDYNDGVGRNRASSRMNNYLPYSTYSQTSYFGGALYDGDILNYYDIKRIDGIDYLFLNLEFGPKDSTLLWANRVVESYPNHRVIVTTHNYTEPNGTMSGPNDAYPSSKYGIGKGNSINDPIEMFDKFVSQHPNIFMTLSGHLSFDDVVYRKYYGVHGNAIHQILIDAQGSLVNSTDMFCDVLALMKFNEAEKKVFFYWYSPLKDKYLNIQNQFEFSFADEKNPSIGSAMGRGE